jgi:hypothetical protein
MQGRFLLSPADSGKFQFFINRVLISNDTARLTEMEVPTSSTQLGVITDRKLNKAFLNLLTKAIEHF